MKHSALVFALAVGSMLAASPDKTRAQRRPEHADTAVGCVDQAGETYVLTGDRQLKTKYTLHGADFADDNFARYLGRKVKVTGKIETGGAFRVKRIETISDTCTPPGQEQ